MSQMPNPEEPFFRVILDERMPTGTWALLGQHDFVLFNGQVFRQSSWPANVRLEFVVEHDP